MSLLALRPQATLHVDLGAVTGNVRTIKRYWALATGAGAALYGPVAR
ncbi:hypothetical protein ACQP00_31185 [Dactylosporangium sp. CS-047395]